MASRKVYRFEPSARLQRYLGSELIADPNLAVLEFVKNSYDAGASEVLVSFSLADPEKTSLLIADNAADDSSLGVETDWAGFAAARVRLDAAHQDDLDRLDELLRERLPQ